MQQEFAFMITYPSLSDVFSSKKQTKDQKKNYPSQQNRAVEMLVPTWGYYPFREGCREQRRQEGRE